jgi:hypothetical protein
MIEKKKYFFKDLFLKYYFVQIKRIIKRMNIFFLLFSILLNYLSKLFAMI